MKEILKSTKQVVEIDEIKLRVFLSIFFPNNGIKNCNSDKIPTNKILKLAKLVISV